MQSHYTPTYVMIRNEPSFGVLRILQNFLFSFTQHKDLREMKNLITLVFNYNTECSNKTLQDNEML